MKNVRYVKTNTLANCNENVYLPISRLSRVQLRCKLQDMRVTLAFKLMLRTIFFATIVARKAVSSNRSFATNFGIREALFLI